MYLIILYIKSEIHYFTGHTKRNGLKAISWDNDINYAKVFRLNKKEKILAKKELAIIKNTVGSEKAKIICVSDCNSQNFYVTSIINNN